MAHLVAVLGGGMAGLSAALLLARDGHRVTLFERDPFVVGGALASPAWERRGIPHFLQPHALIPRGRLELQQELPDVYAALIAAGAHEVDTARKLSGPRQAGDEELQYLAVRRPLVEWALRAAVMDEPAIEVRAPATIDASHGDGAEIVVDAMGRRTPTPGWFPDRAAPTTSDCGVIYLCRYYRRRSGFELPDGPWLVSPRGDIGYFGYATFPGDNETFAALLAIPSGVPEWRGLAKDDRFARAVQSIPMLRRWVDPDGVEPITPVMPMAGLRNSLRSVDEASPFIPVGDALAHTDPTLAHGLSFSLIHARELCGALRDHRDRRDVMAAYLSAVMPEARERYELASALDEQRHRAWLGEQIDVSRHDGGAYELFSIAGAGAAALADDTILRASVRRSGLLDPTAAMDADDELLRRIDEVLAQLRATPRLAAGPPREEMVAIANGTAHASTR